MTIVLAGAVALAAGPSAHAAPGDMDSSFGVDGRVTVNFTPSPFGGYADYAYAVAVQPDRRAIVGGSSLVGHGTGFDSDFALARLLPGGALDPSFGGGDGKVTTDTGAAGSSGQIEEILVQPDGKIIAVGYSGFISSPGVLSPGVVVARYSSAGELDPGFGSGGVATIGVPGAAYAYGAALQPDGKIVVTGQRSAPGFGNETFVARFLTSGTPDPMFGTNGLVHGIGLGGIAYDVAVQADGKVLVGGGGIGVLMAARFTVTGTLDASFGDGGVARLQSGALAYSVEGRAMAMQADGSVLVAGRITETCCSGGAFGVVRLTVDGDLDATFADDGVATVGFDGYAYFGDSASSVVVQPNGKIVVGGQSMQLFPGPVTEFALARFDVDGSLDADFGGDGRVLTPFFYWPGFPNLSSSEIMDLAIAPDGAIVAAGLTFTGAGSQDFAVARYLGDPLDVTPPVITVLANIAVDATSPDGAVVLYSATASDDIDGLVPVSCAPPSGSTFEIGDTTVECTATDAAGNSASGQFMVHVRGADEQIENLITLVDSYELDMLGNSLHAQLAAAQRLLAAARGAAAEEVLAAFVREVRAQRGKGLTEEQADALETAALRIIDVIET